MQPSESSLLQEGSRRWILTPGSRGNRLRPQEQNIHLQGYKKVGPLSLQCGVPAGAQVCDRRAGKHWEKVAQLYFVHMAIWSHRGLQSGGVGWTGSSH